VRVARPVVRNAARSFKTEEGREEKNENPNQRRGIMRPISTVLGVFMLTSQLIAGHYDFNLYDAGFDYPVGWTVSTSTSSSVNINIGYNRRLYLELLPDAEPYKYVLGKLDLLDSLFANMSTWGRGTVDLNGHWGYWIGTSQASKSTFETFHIRADYIRIPKLQRVLVIQYSNDYEDASYWEEDINKISILRSTFEVVNDNVPDRMTLSRTVKSPRNWLEVKYPTNLIGLPDSSDVLKCDAVDLYDYYDQLFLKMRYELRELSPNAKHIDSVLQANRNLFLVMDTLMYGADTFAIVEDTVAYGYRETSYAFGNPGFPMFTWLYAVKDGDYIYQIFYKGFLVDLERSDYVNNLIQNGDRILIPTPIAQRQTPQVKNRKELTIHDFRMLPTGSYVYDLLGRRISFNGNPQRTALKKPSISNGFYIIKHNSEIFNSQAQKIVELK